MKVGEYMATVSTQAYPNYTSIASIKDYWLETIAPNYFDFTNTNNYNIGIFGFVNEVMGNTTENAFNAVAITRREFYPVTAQFTSSLYAMATLQSVEIPLTTPATCRCILIIPQDDIIRNSTYDSQNGIYHCIIDNCLKIFAGDLQFMLDYPIDIISRYTDQWGHTVHYDVSIKNSLASSSAVRYISNKILKENGINYVALFIDCIRQVECTNKIQTVVKDTILDTVTMDVDFDGNLANFEVFYRENPNSEEIQLTKVMINAATPNTPYVQYELINTNKIRLTFAYNNIWYPKFNSEIITQIYTSEGSSGNFNKFTEDLVCSSNSEKYPYNANMTILGRVAGSSTGGATQMLTSEFRNKVIMAYATNKTISTANDLQLYFDDKSDDINGVKILFKKKRDDVFIRLFGAYSVYKDDAGSVIPTNTLETELTRENLVDDLTAVTNTMTIPAGSVFEYKSSDSYTVKPVLTSDGKLMNLIDVIRGDISEDDIYFTSPFMVNINTNPNTCGFYMNSMMKTLPVEYTRIDDRSFQQFIASTVDVYRNAIAGNNFYRFTVSLTPTSDEDSVNYFIEDVDTTDEENLYRAPKDGIVAAEEFYYDSDNEYGYVRYLIKYDDDTSEYIQGSNTLPINRASVQGYKCSFGVGQRFLANDIIAVKRCKDLGNLMICADFGNALVNANAYIAMNIQDYDSSTGSYVLEGFLATNDHIDSMERIEFTHGIFNQAAEEVDRAILSFKNHTFVMNALYRSPNANFSNRFNAFVGFENFTCTNVYESSNDVPFDLIVPLSFIRSTVEFYPIDVTNPSDNQNYQIVIDELPVIGALWGSDRENFDFFIDQYTRVNDTLNDAYLSLNNTFSIDSKFYNTYGKARFFTVGNNVDTMQTLDNVRCKFRIGLKFSTISNTDDMITKIRNFIKEYIEDDSRISIDGQDLFIMNMLSALKEEYDEILYHEYYGFNSYNYMAQKVIGPDLAEYYDEFIPEFLNLNEITDSNGNKHPDIEITILT